jgi:phosphopantetheine--protein transferase-like protein
MWRNIVYRLLNPQIGIDIVDVARFSALEAGNPFFEKTFTEHERAYCAQFADAAPHFAGMFAAKEATSKALGIRTYHVLSLEIRHDDDDAPEVWQAGKKLAVKISISHTNAQAIAVAIG